MTEEIVREITVLNEALANAEAEIRRLREAIREYLGGAPLNEHGQFVDPRREALWRALPPEDRP